MLLPKDVIEATRQRYEATKEEQDRTKALIDAGRRHEADTPQQRMIRRERLMRDPLVREAVADAPEVKSTMMDGASPLEAAAALPSIVFERVIGTPSFLGVAFLSIGLRVARTVVCLHLEDGSRGTGFMVSPTLLLTNHHVFPTRSSAVGARALFNFELDENRKKREAVTFDVNPDRFFLNNKELDYALVALDVDSASKEQLMATFGFNPLSPAMGKVQEAEKVNIIQHPSGALKQVVLQDNDISKRMDHFIQYVADTMPGSSGAPVFNNQWEVIAIHHSGVPDTFEDGPHKGKYRTPSGDVWEEYMGEEGIKWIANEGVRISSILADIGQRTDGLSPEQKELVNALLGAAKENTPARVGEPSVVSPTPIPPTPAPTPTPVSAPLDEERNDPQGTSTASSSTSVNSVGGEISLSIPLEITVRLGSPAYSTAVAVNDSQGIVTGGLERVVIGRDYNLRDGYDPQFLSCLSVPLPALSAAQIADAAQNRQPAPGLPSYVLPYYHFSVAMNKRRKIAFYTAGCVSGELAARFDLGKREGDAWIRDERIGRDEQTNESHYRNKFIDRGHLTRRLDNAWGDSFESALKANNDTFHFTNCSPQHAQFNRNRETWQGLENYILDKLAKDRRILVFNGPIFRDDDPVLNGIQVPMDFWKIVVFCREGGQVTAGGFRVPQGGLIRDLLNESFKPAQFQVKIDSIIRDSGLDFSHLLPYDRFSQMGGPLESESSRSIAQLTDVVF